MLNCYTQIQFTRFYYIYFPVAYFFAISQGPNRDKNALNVTSPYYIAFVVLYVIYLFVSFRQTTINRNVLLQTDEDNNK